MFNNIGQKVKGLAQFICWMGIISSIIGGLILIFAGNTINGFPGTLIGVLVIAAGSLSSWLSSLSLYAIGEAAESSEQAIVDQRLIHKKLDHLLSEINLLKQERAQAAQSADADNTKLNEVTTFVSGNCWMCNKKEVPVSVLEISDKKGTRHIVLCDDCKAKYLSKANSSQPEVEPAADETIGTCDLCGAPKVPITYCAIQDEMGTRYRFLCKNCQEESGGKPLL